MLTVPNYRRAFRALALGMAIAITSASLVIPSSTAVTAVTPTLPAPNGLSEATAAASCWEVKQRDPDAEDGVYWLWTPGLGAPEQFYCDQTTAGGGWVLVGRGRQGWSESNNGSGSPAQVRNPITGPAAFAPRQLSSEKIGGLLNGEPVSTLQDGIRLKRALDQNGTSWQDLNFRFASPRDTWTWQFYNLQRIKDWTVNGVTRTGGSTAEFGADQNFLRVSTTTGSNQGWMYGFGYGTSARGSSADGSYIWAKDASTGNPRPFTQVYLRPQLTSDDVGLAIPPSGTEQSTNSPGAQSFALPTSWGVAGLGNGPRSIEGSNEVSAFAEVDGVIYIGGNFTTVQKTAGGGSAQSQPYLAAFVRDTGEWIRSFRPTLDNQVKSLAAMPDGRLAVGGYFTSVNGEERQGLAVLNATTGALDSAFSGSLVNYLSGGIPVVRALDVQDGWLYAAGSFTHSTGGSQNSEVYTRAAARFNVADGTPDATWNPEFNGTVIGADASARGDRVYFAGYFSASATNPAKRGAAITTDNASVVPWDVHLSSTERAGYQQAVKEVGDRVWLGGSEHSLFSYGRDELNLLSTVVGQRGGDFQAIASDGVTVYGGCHCFDAMYTGASTWPSIGSTWTSADRIYAAGAWSATTAAYKPNFSPELNTRGGAGAWALFVDSTGTLWEGGDFTYSTRPGFDRQWSGGFVRFAPTDTTAPIAPINLSGSTASDSVILSWTAASADSPRYEVLRDNRVVATTAATSATLSLAPEGTKYFVRSVDSAGNRSASTPAVTVTITEPGPQDATFIPSESSWSYLYNSDGPSEGWQDPAFDGSAWSIGQAPLGWGQSRLGTTLPASAPPKPLASFYRKTFNVVDASTVESIALTTRADDGIIVYANGIEVLRQNVDPDASGVNVYANVAVSASSAVNNPITVTVPGNRFMTGENTISAEVHSNYRSTPSHSFELSAVAEFGTQPPPDPDDDADALALILPPGSTWAYFIGNDEVPAEWNTQAFDTSMWEAGRAPLGWGQSELGTTLTTTDSPKPVTSYYRTTIDSTKITADDLTFTTRADDGIVVYLNGEEVKRVNIDAGAITSQTYANAAVSATSALANPVVFTVPKSVLTAGQNVVAAEVHSNYRSTPSHSFEMTVEAP